MHSYQGIMVKFSYHGLMVGLVDYGKILVWILNKQVQYGMRVLVLVEEFSSLTILGFARFQCGDCGIQEH